MPNLIGDTAIVASRMQELNKHLGTRILATERVAAGASGLLWRRLGRYRLPGRTEPETAFEVICPRDHARQQQIDLCARTAYALEAFEARLWWEAEKQFCDLRSHYPEDKASKFLQERCQEFSISPPEGEVIIEVEKI